MGEIMVRDNTDGFRKKDKFMKVFFDDKGKPLSEKERIEIGNRIKTVLMSEFSLYVLTVFIPKFEE